MWDIPNYRIKTYLRNARAQQAREKKRKQRSQLHLRRVKTLLRVTEGLATAADVLEGRLILNEFTADGVKIYTKESLRPGQEISITIEEPRYFFVHARVIWVENISHDKPIISKTPYNYRIGLQFQTQTLAEEKAISAYCKELLTSLLHLPAGI